MIENDKLKYEEKTIGKLLFFKNPEHKEKNETLIILKINWAKLKTTTHVAECYSFLRKTERSFYLYFSEIEDLTKNKAVTFATGCSIKIIPT